MISAVDDGTSPAISTVHPDIIQTHIFTRLDGPTLVSAACASSHLHALSTDDSLWRQICNDTWPSTKDPRVRHVIESLPHSHRSFYSDCFPALPTNIISVRKETGNRLKETAPPCILKKNDILPSIFKRITDFKLSPQPMFAKKTTLAPPPQKSVFDLVSSELISAVDLKFMNRPILSRVVTTETGSGWFSSSPFRVDALDPKETVQTGVPNACLELMSLSWVVIDPARGRAADFSSSRPVQVARHWLTGDVHVRFATVVRRSKERSVQCAAVVTCRAGEAGEVYVREVSLVVEDMEGRSLSGEGSLVILRGAMGSGERRRRRDGKEERERYERFTEMKREIRERKERGERRMDVVCIFTVVILLVTWGSLLLKISS